MKAYIIQPHYSTDYKEIDDCIKEELSLIAACDAAADIIVLPECCDVLAAVPSDEDFIRAMEKYGPIIDKAVKDAAKRCNSVVFANYGYKTEKGYRNTTHIINGNGEEIGKYFKAHPAPSEIKNRGIDTDYANYPQDVYTVDIKGIRFGFRTCYDFYFYEDIIQMSRKNIDIIIGCSYQRTDTHQAIEIIDRFLCYNTNAYLLRSSISLGKDSKVCGCSMAVAPDGKVLADMKNRVGILTVDFDPKKKYYKPSGFNGIPRSHHEYVDEGRKV